MAIAHTVKEFLEQSGVKCAVVPHPHSESSRQTAHVPADPLAGGACPCLLRGARSGGPGSSRWRAVHTIDEGGPVRAVQSLKGR